MTIYDKTPLWFWKTAWRYNADNWRKSVAADLTSFLQLWGFLGVFYAFLEYPGPTILFLLPAFVAFVWRDKLRNHD